MQHSNRTIARSFIIYGITHTHGTYITTRIYTWHVHDRDDTYTTATTRKKYDLLPFFRVFEFYKTSLGNYLISYIYNVISISEDHWNQTSFSLLSEKTKIIHVMILNDDIVGLSLVLRCLPIVKRCCIFSSHLCTGGFRPMDTSTWPSSSSVTTIVPSSSCDWLQASPAGIHNYSAIQFLWLASSQPCRQFCLRHLFVFNTAATFLGNLLCEPPYVYYLFATFAHQKLHFMQEHKFAAFYFVEKCSHSRFCSLHFDFLSCGLMP